MVDTKVAEGFVELTLDTAKLTQGLANAQKSFTRSLRSIQRGADRAGKALSLALTVPLIAAGVASGKVAGTFETNLAKIVGLVGVAGDEVARLGDEVLQLAPQVGKGPVELSEALFTITSAGSRGQEALDILTASAKAATAGLGNTGDVAKATGSAIQAFAKDNLTAAQTVSTLVNIVKKGNVEGRDLATTFSRVTPFAAALGIALNEAGAGMAVITLTAPDASQAATQLEALFRSLGRSTPIFEEALDKLGLSFEGVQSQLQQDGLLATLRTLQKEANRTGTRLNELFVDSSAAAGAMAILNIDAALVDDIFKALAETTENDLDKAFRAVADTGAFKFTQSLVSIQTAATQLGQVILPILAPVVLKISAAVITAGNAFAQLDSQMQETILTGLALAAALGPALIIFGLMVGAIANVVVALKVFVTGFVILSRVALVALRAVALGFITLGTVVLSAIGTILGAIFSIPGVIAAVGVAVVLFRKTVVEAFKGLGTVIFGPFELLFGLLQQGFARFINNTIDEINTIRNFVNLDPIEFRIEGPTDSDLQEISDKIDEAFKFKKTRDQFTADLDGVTETIKSSFDAIKNIIGGATDLFSFDLSGFDLLTDKLPDFTNKIKESVAELNKSISANFDDTLKKLTQGIGKLEAKTKSTADSVKGVLTDVSGSISSSITDVITGATSALDALQNVVNSIISSIVSNIIGSPGGGGLLGGLFASAKGNVFSGGSPVPFADGGVITGRTVFPMGNGGQGLAGEAGNEAIFPLTRVAGGGLGISAEGVSNDNVVINQINNFTPDVRATVREEIANAAPLLIGAAKQATIAALGGRRV